MGLEYTQVADSSRKELINSSLANSNSIHESSSAHSFETDTKKLVVDINNAAEEEEEEDLDPPPPSLNQ